MKKERGVLPVPIIVRGAGVTGGVSVEHVFGEVRCVKKGSEKVIEGWVGCVGR